jgi:hypothetical protein
MMDNTHHGQQDSQLDEDAWYANWEAALDVGMTVNVDLAGELHCQPGEGGKEVEGRIVSTSETQVQVKYSFGSDVVVGLVQKLGWFDRSDELISPPEGAGPCLVRGVCALCKSNVTTNDDRLADEDGGYLHQTCYDAKMDNSRAPKIEHCVDAEPVDDAAAVAWQQTKGKTQPNNKRARPGSPADVAVTTPPPNPEAISADATQAAAAADVADAAPRSRGYRGYPARGPPRSVMLQSTFSPLQQQDSEIVP